MNKKNVIILGITLVVAGAAIASYFLFFQANRDTQSVESAFTISSEALVGNCLSNIAKTSSNLLAENGESTVFVVEGKVVSSETDQNGETVVYLYGGDSNPLVRCTFLKESSTENIAKDQVIKVKGVFRSCAEIDRDLDLMEDAVVDECALYE